MSKDYCIEYTVNSHGKKYKNRKFIDILYCIDNDYRNENQGIIKFEGFSIRRAEKLVREYCKRHFDMNISRREISSICYPQKGYFSVRAGIILMAMYNLLKGDSEQNEKARKYIMDFFEQKYSDNEEEVLEFVFGGLPEKISQCIQDISGNHFNTTMRLWHYYCFVERRLVRSFENQTWMTQVRKGFPVNEFEADTAYNIERKGRVYLVKGNKISLF